MDTHAHLGQIMSEDFAVLPGESSPAEARRLLGGRRFGIVTGEDGVPVSLITGKDLEVASTDEAAILRNPAVTLPPLVSGPPDIGLAAVAEDPRITLLSAGAHGIVVSLSGTPLGVVPTGEVESYLGLGPDVQLVETLGFGLGGDIGNLTANVTCNFVFADGTVCRTPNSVQFHDPARPQACQRQPPLHALTILKI